MHVENRQMGGKSIEEGICEKNKREQAAQNGKNTSLQKSVHVKTLKQYMHTDRKTA